MKIVFFGTPEFSVPALQILLNSKEIEVAAVVTQKDKAIGRKQEKTFPPVKTKALEYNIPVIQEESSEELFKILEKIPADFYVVVAFGMIMPQKILDLPRNGSINIHASLLPKYRGASPIQESLLNGDQSSGVTIMRMDSKLDHGDIYLIRRIEIEEKDNLQTLSAKLSVLGASIIVSALKDIKSGLLSPIRQNHKEASYCHKIVKEDGLIDLNKSAAEIKNMIRAYNPWPGSYIIVDNKKLKIIETEISESEKLKAGEFKVEKKVLKIGTKKGILIPNIVQLEGKTEMNIDQFLNGFSKIFS